VFYADIVVEELIVLELKVAEMVTKQFEAQLVHYLRATEYEVGLVLAFGERARFKRAMMTNERKRPGQI
jgi:GxxExxY protein